MTISRFDVHSDQPYADDQPFAATGRYRAIDGLVTGVIEPDDPAAAQIVDLHTVSEPRHYRARMNLIVPVDAPATTPLLVDVPNRGNRLAPRLLNRARLENLATTPDAAGDGFLFEAGFALATIGWQWDVDPTTGFHCDVPDADGLNAADSQVVIQLQPNRDAAYLPVADLGLPSYPVATEHQTRARLSWRAWPQGPDNEIPRDNFRFARLDQAREEQPSNFHVLLEGGFTAGTTYVLTYPTERSPVAGCGLLALRDITSWLRHGELHAPWDGCGATIGFGVSQTGRVLRHLLHLGLNADRQGRRVFDGLLVHIGGAQRGDFNHRYARPGSLGAPSFGQTHPFSSQPTSDPHGSGSAGLLDRCHETDTVPKVMITNSAYEYWRGDAALNHIDPATGADLPEPPLVRHYLIAGTHHVNGVLPPTDRLEATGERTQRPLNTVDMTPILRALLTRLRAWIEHDQQPPASRVPTTTLGTAAHRTTVLDLCGLLGPALPQLAPERLPVLTALDLGTIDGVGCYPAQPGAAYPVRVAAVDADGNEIAGIRLPQITVPVATHSGWNPRHPAHGAAEQMAIFAGFSVFFAANPERRVAGDQRPALTERYTSRDDFLDRVQRAAQQLIEEGFLLERDRSSVVNDCATLFDYVMQTAT